MSDYNSLACSSINELISSSFNGYHIRIKEYNNIQVSSNWYISNRQMKRWLLVFVKSGYGQYIIKDTVLSLKPGQLLCIGPNTCHHVEVDPNTPPSFIAVHFNLFDQNGHIKHNLHNKAFAIALNFINDTQILNRFESLSRTEETKEQYIVANIHGNMLAIMSKIYEHLAYKNKVQGYIHPTARKAKALIDYHIYEAISIESIANELNHSRKYISELFKSTYSITPKKYQQEQRIAVAKSLLLKNNLSVSAVSNILNYSDPFTFSKQFKKLTGLSPSEFLKIIPYVNES